MCYKRTSHCHRLILCCFSPSTSAKSQFVHVNKRKHSHNNSEHVRKLINIIVTQYGRHGGRGGKREIEKQ